MLTRHLGLYDPHLSVSQARTLLTCPRQWAFSHVQRITKVPTGKMVEGSQLDKALTMYFSREGNLAKHLAACTQDVCEAFEQVMREYSAVTMAFTQRRTEFQLDGDLLVIGFSDAITSSGVYIDWKFRGRPGDETWLLSVKKQIATYWYGDHLDGDKGWGLIVCASPRKCQSISFEIDEDLVELALEDLRQARKVQESGQYQPNPGMYCGWCRYNPECREELEEVYSCRMSLPKRA